MTRRRADIVVPFAEIPNDDLTDDQRVAAQDAVIAQYEGRKDREAWDRRFWRGRHGDICNQPRPVRPRTGSQRGSPTSHAR